MDKKKIGIISFVIIGIVALGLGFNNLFTKAQFKDDAKSNVVSSQEVTTVSKEESKEENKDENKEESKKDKEDNKENKEENKEDKNTDKKQDKEDKYVNDNKDDESSDDKENESSSSTEKPSQSKPSKPDVQKPKPSKPSNPTKPSKPETENTKPSKPSTKTVTIAISCKTAIKNGINKEPEFAHLPSSGSILSTMTVEIEPGDSVFDVLVKATRKNGIHMEYTGSGSSIYVEGINNLYEFDGGKDSGWMYSVNGVYPNYGCGAYKLKGNEVIKWNYTCDLGKDLGAR